MTNLITPARPSCSPGRCANREGVSVVQRDPVVRQRRQGWEVCWPTVPWNVVHPWEVIFCNSIWTVGCGGLSHKTSWLGEWDIFWIFSSVWLKNDLCTDPYRQQGSGQYLAVSRRESWRRHRWWYRWRRWRWRETWQWRSCWWRRREGRRTWRRTFWQMPYHWAVTHWLSYWLSDDCFEIKSSNFAHMLEVSGSLMGRCFPKTKNHASCWSFASSKMVDEFLLVLK